MWFEDQLKSLIAKAADDFDEAAAADIKVKSEEDNTTRGEFLDGILAAQKAEREQLWKRLHQLEDRHREAGLQKIAGTDNSPEQKVIQAAQGPDESAQLFRHSNSVHQIARPDEEDVLEIQFKDQLYKSVAQFRKALEYIREEFRDATEALTREETVLAECSDIKTVLSRRVDEARQQGRGYRRRMQMRETMDKLRLNHEATMNDLVDFLDQHYPAHRVKLNPDADWDEEENEVEYELKYLLEDLMNLAVINPTNPYVQLESGMYWPPYVETLIKAGIAVRHPEDALRIRLVDYRL
ncbi:hypothetical protein DFQ30_006107 [Apophysomyces sp. BC1015]|nr:hypothetical protein DFQ30_006107 [Apophysomyces sp. BC1015]